MADFEVDNAEGGDDKPKKKRPAPKPKPAGGGGGGGGGGGIVTILLAVVAIVAIVGCVFLFMQMAKLKAQLGEAGVPTPSGLGGQAEVAEGEGHEGDGGHGEDPYSWQDSQEEIKYPLGKFTAKTADGKNAVMTLTLKLTSGITGHERERYEFEMKIYEQALKDYNKEVEEYIKKNKLAAVDPDDRLAGLSERDFVCGGFILLQHGAPAATGPPEMPHPPEKPHTILEQKLTEKQDEVREIVIDEINARTTKELDNKAGRGLFKTEIVTRINGIIDKFDGEVTDVIISDIITA